MSRNVWLKRKLSQGDTVQFDGKTWKVLSQIGPMDSYHFKSRYYTSLYETQEPVTLTVDGQGPIASQAVERQGQNE